MGSKVAPDNTAAIDHSGIISRFRCESVNDDGSVFVVADLLDGSAISGKVTCRGAIRQGEPYTFLGHWDKHAKWDWQFKFDDVIPDIPSEPEGLASYIAKTCDGIGIKTARKLVEALTPQEVIDALCNRPHLAVEADILSIGLAESAASQLRAEGADPLIREMKPRLHALFAKRGFSQETVLGAIAIWRGLAEERIRRDPYLMMTNGIPGAGFIRCDSLYIHLDRPPNRRKRQALAVQHALQGLDGHTWLSIEDAREAIEKRVRNVDVQWRSALAMLERSGRIETRLDANGWIWIAERSKAIDESHTATALMRLAGKPALWPDPRDIGLDSVEDAHQIEQLQQALKSRVAILLGSPGTGKSFCAALLIRECVRYYGKESIGVCSPTGKASVRMTELMQKAGVPLQATTMHKMLFTRKDKEGFLPYKVLVGDECSMVDCELSGALFSACPTGTHVLLIGDPGQLPPVGHGCPLRDMIDADLPRGTLTQIRRNSGRIVQACAEIRDGKTPAMPTSLNAFLQDEKENLVHIALGVGKDARKREEKLHETLINLYTWIGQQPPKTNSNGHVCQSRWDLIDDVQVICPKNDTRIDLNKWLQDYLNPRPDKDKRKKWRLGDKVCCLKNGRCLAMKLVTAGSWTDYMPTSGDHYVANGDFGRIVGFKSLQMVIQLSCPDRLIAVPLGKQGEAEQEIAASAMGVDDPDSKAKWDLAFAATVHRMQGSQAPVVIVVVDPVGILGSRELLYTALSRAQELCFVIGDLSEVGKYVRNIRLPERKTFLAQMLRGEIKP